VVALLVTPELRTTLPTVGFIPGCGAARGGRGTRRAAAPRASAAALQRASAWLTRQYWPISIGVGLVFGGYFLGKGLTGLLT
jgi:hypothetical protein